MAELVVTRLLTANARQALEASEHAVWMHMAPDPPSREQLLAEVEGARGLVCALTERIDAEVMDRAGDQLEVIANVAVGVDNVDLREAKRRGIVVTNTPDVLTDATADLAMGLIIAACRRIGEADRFMRRGTDWTWGPTFFVGPAVTGASLGIVGYGRIGQAVAKRAKAFDMDVLATGGRFLDEHGPADGVRTVDLDQLLSSCDIVSLHCPLTDETRGLIGESQLARMKPTAVLVNTARGPIVDEKALVKALQDGDIAGAGLDVFENEPAAHPGLLDLDNVILAPHIGSADRATRERMCQLAVDNALRVLGGGDALTRVV
jgi:lactate dehydrogenase-like 2-hydroxyacid dehydrogenase